MQFIWHMVFIFLIIATLTLAFVATDRIWFLGFLRDTTWVCDNFLLVTAAALITVNGFWWRRLLLALHGNSCCLGGLAKPQSQQHRVRKVPAPPSRRDIPTTSRSRRSTRQWSSSSVVMENKGSSSQCIETLTTLAAAPVNEETRVENENSNGATFVNQAELDWQERRKEWTCDRSRKTCKVSREPIISWSTTYEDLLSTSQPFPQPIPLAEMVDFLVDVWHEEGLYD